MMKKIAASLTAMLILVIATAASAATGAPVAAVAPDEPNAAPAASQAILTEGFEGSWPGGGWSVSHLSQPYWGKDDFKPYAGASSVWPAREGANAVDPAMSVYPNNLSTPMVYGPFDLSDALSAEVRFWLWLETEVDYDYLYFGSSSNGSTFTQEGNWEGTLDWSEIVVDLTPYAGDSSVWLRWYFFSDISVGLGGAFIDDVAITKVPLASPVVSISRSGSNVHLAWPAIGEAASYEVWRAANSPYFTPGADCAGTPSSCVSVTNNFYDHAGGSGSTTNNYTYVVRSVSGNIKSIVSSRMGEFDFALTR